MPPPATRPVHGRGAAPTSGSLTIGPSDPGSPGIYTYGLTCVGPGGSGANSTSLTVVPRPTLTLDLNPQSVPVGGTANLTWSSANTNSCQASGNWSGAEPTNGAQTLGPLPAGTYGYTLTCVGPAGGSVALSQTLTVNPSPTVTIALVPSDLAIGSAAALTWSATTATACEASGAWTGSVTDFGHAEHFALGGRNLRLWHHLHRAWRQQLCHCGTDRVRARNHEHRGESHHDHGGRYRHPDVDVFECGKSLGCRSRERLTCTQRNSDRQPVECRKLYVPTRLHRSWW